MEMRQCVHRTRCNYLNKDVFKTIKLAKRKTLFSGASTNVYLARYKTHPRTEVAAKVYPLKDLTGKNLNRALDTFHRESSILRKLNHENIIMVIHPFMCPSYAVILTEYFPGGSLYEHYKELNDVQVRRFFVQISNALEYIHGKRIVHRDVKHQNVLLKGNDAYLTDFGLAKRLPDGDDTLASFAGTPEYIAPEVYQNYAIASPYDAFKADSFGLGVILWVLIMKEDREEGDLSVCRLIEPKRAEFPVLTDTAIQLLQTDPMERKTVRQILVDLKCRGYDFINHPQVDQKNGITEHTQTQLGN